jgi:hypothetical protein
MSEKHLHYYEVNASSHFEMGRAIGETTRDVTRNWVDRKLADPVFGKKADQAKAYLDLIKQYFPEYVEELLGLSQSLGLSLIEIWALSLEEELDYLDTPPSASLSPDHCTTVITNEGMLLGHTEDEDPGSEESLVILKRALNGYTVLELYFLGTLGGTSLGINSHGYISTRNVLADYNTQYGIPRGTMMRYLSETNNPEHHLRVSEQMPRRMGGSLVFTSQKGEVTTAETTAKKVALLRPELPFVHTNHYLIPEMKQFDHNPNTTATFERYQVAQDKVKPHMTPAELRDLMSDQSRGPHESIFNERTIGRAVVDWPTLSAWFWLKREQEKGWVKYEVDFLDK